MPILGIMASSRPAFELVGSYDSLATVTLSATTASITFAGIPSGYKHLQIRFIARGASGGAIYTQFNGDTASNYSAHTLYGNGTSALANSQTSTNIPLIIRDGGISTTANIFSAGIVDILDYASTSKAKTLRSLAGQDLNGSGIIELASNLWFATPAAITSITMTQNGSGFTQYSSFALYGIR